MNCAMQYQLDACRDGEPLLPQGVPGAYSEMAVQELFQGYAAGVRTVPKESFEAAYEAVEKAEVDYALLPFENTLGGSIHANYDLCMRHHLYAIAEVHRGRGGGGGGEHCVPFCFQVARAKHKFNKYISLLVTTLFRLTLQPTPRLSMKKRLLAITLLQLIMLLSEK